MADANDIKFRRLEKEAVDGKVCWMVDAQVETSWSKAMDVRTIYAFTIDAETGDVLKAETAL